MRHQNHTMMFWADILQEYDDNMLLQVPPDAIAMEWGYEDNHPFFANCQRLADAGIPFYVCPGTSSWNSLVGRTANCIENIRNACMAGRVLNAQGMLVRPKREETRRKKEKKKRKGGLGMTGI